MSDDGNREGRWTDGPRRLLQGLGALVATRLELLLVEAQEEKQRALIAVAMACGAVALAGIGLTLLTVALVMAVPQPARLPLVTGLGVVYCVGAWLLFAALRRSARESPPPFAETRKQFEKDRQWLNPRS
jgi:uncharacterized membrane protein YqjE